MILSDTFIVSFDVREDKTLKFCETMQVKYRTEELNPYLRIPNIELNLNHLHTRDIKNQVHNLFNIPRSSIEVIDIIRTY